MEHPGWLIGPILGALVVLNFLYWIFVHKRGPEDDHEPTDATAFHSGDDD